MKYSMTRVGAIGTALITTSLLGVGGVASADSYNSGSPCSHSNDSSVTTSSWQGYSGNQQWTSSDWSMMNMSSWNMWNPMTYASNGGNFSQWWNSSMTQMNNESAANWSGNDSNSNWTPMGSDWQSNWSNWNPVMWENNGSSYSNWYNQMMSYMNSNYGNFQSDFN
jgi:hypothetical protein